MSDMTAAYAVGDRVWVSSPWRRQRKPATVVKIGRTLVHLDEGGHRPVAYYRDGQHDRNGYNSYFQTDEQVAAVERRTVARQRLRDAGVEIQLGYDSQWPVEHVEALAEFVARLRRGVADG